MAKTEYLLHEQLWHVLAALTPTNRLVCRVCLHTGLRLGDVLALRTEELARQFFITESKTKKRRRVGLTDELIHDIKAQAGATWAFPSAKGDSCGHWTRQAVWKDVKRAAKAFRLPQNVAPHSLRKVYAVQLRDKYGDMGRVQRALNHDSPVTTMIYAMADHLLQSGAPRRKHLA